MPFNVPTRFSLPNAAGLMLDGNLLATPGVNLEIPGLTLDGNFPEIAGLRFAGSLFVKPGRAIGVSLLGGLLKRFRV